jgi:hypothetical protein
LSGSNNEVTGVHFATTGTSRCLLASGNNNTVTLVTFDGCATQALEVTGAGNEFRSVTVDHTGGSADAITVNAPLTTLTDVTITDCPFVCVTFEPLSRGSRMTTFTISDSLSATPAIQLKSFNATLRDGYIQNCADVCVSVSGDDARLESVEIFNSTGTALDLSGARIKIVDGKIDSCGSKCISISSTAIEGKIEFTSVHSSAPGSDLVYVEASSFAIQ